MSFLRRVQLVTRVKNLQAVHRYTSFSQNPLYEIDNKI